jgi:hypothetical protein
MTGLAHGQAARRAARSARATTTAPGPRRRRRTRRPAAAWSPASRAAIRPRPRPLRAGHARRPRAAELFGRGPQRGALRGRKVQPGQTWMVAELDVLGAPAGWAEAMLGGVHALQAAGNATACGAAELTVFTPGTAHDISRGHGRLAPGALSHERVIGHLDTLIIFHSRFAMINTVHEGHVDDRLACGQAGYGGASMAQFDVFVEARAWVDRAAGFDGSVCFPRCDLRPPGTVHGAKYSLLWIPIVMDNIYAMDNIVVTLGKFLGAPNRERRSASRAGAPRRRRRPRRSAPGHGDGSRASTRCRAGRG